MSFMNEDFNAKYMSGVPKTPAQQVFTYQGQNYNAAGVVEKAQQNYLNKINAMNLAKFNADKAQALKEYQKGKVKTLSQIAQNAVSSGLSNTPILAQSEKAYESEVGDPLRYQLNQQYLDLQRGIVQQNLEKELQNATDFVKQQQEQFTSSQYTPTPYYSPTTTNNNVPAFQTGAEIAKSMNSGSFNTSFVLPQSAINDIKSGESELFGI